VGYGYDFKREEAMKNLLRTHTTAISAQMLYRWEPHKPWSWDETVCLTRFHQAGARRLHAAEVLLDRPRLPE
jgi:hypothetical protein